jgi:hypothetical protein
MAKQSHLSAALGGHAGRVRHQQPPDQPMLPMDIDPEQQQEPSLLLAMLAGQDQSGMPPPQRRPQ